MRIGILTFHKAINYGAYLQAFSLSHKLQEQFPNDTVEIIDYIENDRIKKLVIPEGVKIIGTDGIYCSNYYWTSFFGSSYKFAYASSIPMWYAHYDYDASFSDWTSFGGWSQPTIKQYQGTTSLCSASVDLNYQG